MKKIIIIFLLNVLLFHIAQPQSIGIGTTSPNISALLDVNSISKGMLVPRMTTAQRLAISSPATGLLVFDTDTNCFWFYAGASWSKLITNGSGWLLNGNSGINPASFIGTTDNQPIIFRTNTQFRGSLGVRDNVLFGSSSGLLMDTLSTSNIGIGSFALYNNKSRSHIIAIGESALRYNGMGAAYPWEGTENTAVGDNAMTQDSTGYRNSAFGSFALGANSTGSYNLALGASALMSNTTASSNTALGALAMQANTEGSDNTAVGTGSLAANTTGSLNVSIGINSLASNTTGSQNAAVGAGAMTNNKTGAGNTAIGMNALYNDTSGSGNTSVGNSSLLSNFNGSSNVAVGNGNSIFNQTGSLNTSIGANAFYSHITGDNNVSAGAYALFSDSIGLNNTAIGYHASYLNKSGYSNVAVGTDALYKSTGSNLVAIGDSALYNNAGGYHNTAIGSKSLFSNASGYNNTAIGFRSLFYNVSGNDNTAIGMYSLIGNGTGSGNTANGSLALASNISGSYNTATGFQALTDNSSGTSNTAHGSGALMRNISGTDNTATGANALLSNTIGSLNTAVGSGVLYLNKSGASNTAVGNASMLQNTSGFSNTALGSHALYLDTAGVENAAIGSYALASNFGSRNTALGANALNLTGTGSRNTGIGYSAMVGTGALANATAIGSNAQVDCSNCIVLGSINGVNGATSDVNVGIGVTIPQQRLSIKNGMNIDQTDQNTGAFDNNVLRFGNASGEAIGSSRSGSNNMYGLDFYTGTAKHMVITHDGNVGIGINNPNVPLSFPAFLGKKITLYPGATGDVGFAVWGNQLQIYSDNPNASVRLGYDQAGTFTSNLDVFGNGNATLRGTLTQNSDIRLKKNILPIESSLNNILKLNGYRYQWEDEKMDSSIQIGLIAQEVQKQFPEVVKENAKGELSVNYSGMIPLLITAIKEQQQQIEELKKEIHALKEQK